MEIVGYIAGVILLLGMLLFIYCLMKVSDQK